MRRFIVSMAAIMVIWGAAVHSSARSEDAEASVRRRIAAYWDAMVKGDFAEAARYVHPESRAMFQHKVSKSRYEKWSIRKLDFNSDQTVCDATIMVNKPVAIFDSKVVAWPLQNQWVLTDGEWYFKLPWRENENPTLEMLRGQQASSVQAAELDKGNPARPARPPGVLPHFRRFTPDRSNPAHVNYGEKVVFRYRFSNETDHPVRIVSAHGDCHCTGVAKDHPEVPPGEQGVVEITLDTFGLPLGPVEKEVSVTFSDLPEPRVIRLSTTNIPNFKLTPPGSVDFGEIPPGKPAEKTVHIANQSRQPVRILSTLKSDPKLTVSLAESVVEPGKEIVVTLRYDSQSPGEFLDSVMLRTDLESEPLVTLSVRGWIGAR
jgi:hypothetical protein